VSVRDLRLSTLDGERGHRRTRPRRRAARSPGRPPGPCRA
jgi:hypothetical protein